jgi:membrane protein implicated in regulation of membrane protease activity
MLGLLMEEGEHTVSFYYHNEAFSLGWKVSLGCFLVFAALYIIFYRPRMKRKKGKYER